MSEDEIQRIRKAKNEYMRKWHRSNPGKQAEYQKTYWLKRAKEKNL